jgi:hypothetical protein
VLPLLLSVTFGFIALSQIRKRPQRGRGLAITGLVLSGWWTLVLAALITAGLVVTAHGSFHSERVSGKGTVSVFSLRSGDCFLNPADPSDLRNITSVIALPCGMRHNAQVVAVFRVAGPSYPGRVALAQRAEAGCRARLRRDVDTSKVTGSMSVRFLFPKPSSWATGHRKVSCLVVDARPDLKSSVLRAHHAG